MVGLRSGDSFPAGWLSSASSRSTGSTCASMAGESILISLERQTSKPLRPSCPGKGLAITSAAGPSVKLRSEGAPEAVATAPAVVTADAVAAVVRGPRRGTPAGRCQGWLPKTSRAGPQGRQRDSPRRPRSQPIRTKKLWIYDFRTNQSFTLKTRMLKRSGLDDFVACYNPANRQERTETERFRAFTYEELMARDKASLDIFWLRDESLEDTDNLPAPDVIAAEIVEDLEAALVQFAEIAATLPRTASSEG